MRVGGAETAVWLVAVREMRAKAGLAGGKLAGKPAGLGDLSAGSSGKPGRDILVKRRDSLIEDDVARFARQRAASFWTKR